MAIDFAGTADPISDTGFGAAVTLLGVDAATVWSIVSVETSGCGFLADRRPKILFERHIFHKQTNGRFDTAAPDLSDPNAGGYGPAGSNQYDRLARAVALDRKAALSSASWGLGQVMGFNYAAAGFGDVETMVADMMVSEDVHLLGMARFIATNKLAAALQAKSWDKFAAHYNGPNYQENDYDGKLSNFYAHYSTGKSPDLLVRAAQIYLTYLGQDPGPIDGMMGRRTSTALSNVGLGPTIEAATIAQLKLKLT